MNIKDIENIVSQLRNADTTGNRPYKVYTALLSQSSTSPPAVTILENTAQLAITWAYDNVGVYSGEITSPEGGLDMDKTGITIASPRNAVNSFVNAFLFGFTGYSTILKIETYYDTGNSDEILIRTLLEIRVYP